MFPRSSASASAIDRPPPEALPRCAFGIGRVNAVNQQHEAERSLARIAQGESGRERKVGAGRITSYGDPGRVDQAGALARGEADHRHHLVERNREPVLR
jgi:hypothetical protein